MGMHLQLGAPTVGMHLQLGAPTQWACTYSWERPQWACTYNLGAMDRHILAARMHTPCRQAHTIITLSGPPHLLRRSEIRDHQHHTVGSLRKECMYYCHIVILFYS